MSLVGLLALSAPLSGHSEYLLRKITVKLKPGAIGRRFDPLIHDKSNVLLKK